MPIGAQPGAGRTPEFVVDADFGPVSRKVSAKRCSVGLLPDQKVSRNVMAVPTFQAFLSDQARNLKFDGLGTTYAAVSS